MTNKETQGPVSVPLEKKKEIYIRLASFDN